MRFQGKYDSGRIREISCGNPTLLTRLDKLTLDFILAVIITDCLIGFFIWYEVFYKAGDSRLATAIGIGAGTAIALAVTIVTFAHWEAIRMISERYKRLQFEEGRKVGREEERKEGEKALEAERKEREKALEAERKEREKALEAERQRFREILGQSGVELAPEVEERLFGRSEKKRS